MLEKFRAAKADEIRSLEELDNGSGLPAPSSGPKPPFAATLKTRGPGAVVAEYKRASPSKGEINMALGPGDVARLYKDAGATALSVLTEEVYFKGSLGYLDDMAQAGLPMLRKDFLFHPLQIRRTAATPASALLLIVRMLETERELEALHTLAMDLGLECVVEVFDERDLDLAQSIGSRIIQVNNRDLGTLDIDLATSLRLVPRKQDGEVWIAASGLSTASEVASMAEAGFDAVLVGTSLMREQDPGRALAGLVNWRTRV